MCMCVCVCVCVCVYRQREIKREILNTCLLILVASVMDPAEEADCITFEWQRLQGSAVKLKASQWIGLYAVVYPGILFWGGVQQIQLRTEDRENGDLGAVAP